MSPKEEQLMAALKDCVRIMKHPDIQRKISKTHTRRSRIYQKQCWVPRAFWVISKAPLNFCLNIYV